MKKLIVVEGFDRCGKDTLLDDLKNQDTNFYVYIEPLVGLPKYDKEQGDFLVWLNQFISCQVRELNKLFKTYDTVVMCRLIVSDEVYSTMFNREHTVEKYLSQIECDEICNYCMLFKDYDEYLKRLALIGDTNIQYDRTEFDRINELYINILSKFSGTIKYIYSDTSREDVVEHFKDYINKITQ